MNSLIMQKKILISFYKGKNKSKDAIRKPLMPRASLQLQLDIFNFVCHYW